MRPKITQSKCLMCYECVDVCPVGAIRISKKNQKPFIKNDDCIDCGSCIEMCPVGAIKRKK